MEIIGCLALYKNSTGCLVGRVWAGPSGAHIECILEPPNKMLLAITTTAERRTGRYSRVAHMDTILFLDHQDNRVQAGKPREVTAPNLFPTKASRKAGEKI